MLKAISNFLIKHAGVATGCLVALMIVAIYAVSWLVTCGIIKLITMCFGWDFTWAMATGVWLIICIAKSIFKNTTTVKK